MPEPESYEYAEERRLLYVSLTRARVACHLITPLQEPSLFAVELLEQEHGVAVGPQHLETVRCPLCGSGVLTSSSRDGGTHRSNSPYCIFRSPKCDICDQRLHATSLNPIHFGCVNHSNRNFTPCPKCKWGILIERRGRHGEFFGCSNYAVTGCTGKATSGYRTRRF
jgi:DNA helicase-4